ncbi:hypothetical protein EJ04DRAFT_118648 [Polyplosphaeria fusca]|uniref:Uncharacterized protein n=1 Tax=Polyplosphaeria fusca TaxID=682080 RepID=A0A9P4V5I0_9PLEO|nr:hypothetical protein EJ04DRAFT_118648 [Polyplosphaeria fusca]
MSASKSMIVNFVKRVWLRRTIWASSTHQMQHWLPFPPLAPPSSQTTSTVTERQKHSKRPPKETHAPALASSHFQRLKTLRSLLCLDWPLASRLRLVGRSRRGSFES